MTLRHNEVMIIAISISILAFIACLAYTSEDDFDPIVKFVFMALIIVAIMCPIGILYHYLYKDSSKVLIQDEESGKIIYYNGSREETFELTDIVSITFHVWARVHCLGYYEISVKDKQPIQVSVFLPVPFIIEYAKKNDIYRELGEFLAVMD